MNKILIKITAVMVVTVIVICMFSTVYGATTPTLVNKLNSILKKIKEYMVKLAGPAAALAIATGVMIRKLSFGDEEKMVIGKRVIINAIFCYFIILLVDLIVKFIEALV